ncbi:MAG: aminotransferase class III-fold pyridoxal phosphate-dependent enzyme [Candidatus Bathyarchaeia archaeon]
MAKLPRITVMPPGPYARKLLSRDEQLISPSYMRLLPLAVKSGEGCILRDVDGNEYIDLSAGLACLNLGHQHPKVVEAIKNQCSSLIHYPFDAFYREDALVLAEKLIEIAPGSFEKKVFFDNSQSEAIETALKLSRWHTRKQLFLSFIGASHGQTFGALSVSASDIRERSHFFQLLPGVIHVPYPYCYRCFLKQNYPDCHCSCVDFIEDMILRKLAPPEDVAAITIEPIQWRGCVVAPQEYFSRLRKLADKYDFLLVDDESRTGIGRTGKWFAIEHWNIEPDILCCGNVLASGLPLAATIAKSKLMDWMEGSHAGSSGGNPLSCAAAIAVIDAIKEERLLENAVKQGTYILKRLRELKDECEIIGDVRGKGLMIGLEIVENLETSRASNEQAREIVLRAWRQGVITTLTDPSTIVLTPPLTITREVIDGAMEIICDVIREVASER